LVIVKYGYYTGCSVTTSENEMERSLRGVLEALTLNLEEFETPGCCGCAHPGKEVEPAKEMLIEEIVDLTEGVDSLIVPCPSCYRAICSLSEERAEKIPKIVHPLELLTTEPIRSVLRAKRVRHIKGLKIAPYYGCIFQTPAAEWGEKKHPLYMEQIFEVLGVDTVWFPESRECCGGQRHMDSLDAWGPVSRRIMDTASRWGADIVSVACSQCHSLLEGITQSDRIVGGDDAVVLYYSQIAGYVMGLDTGLLFPEREEHPLAERLIEEGGIAWKNDRRRFLS
jgi:heterodisulfide reductase subunit B